MIQSSKHIESVGGFGSGSFINYSLFMHMLSHNGSEGWHFINILLHPKTIVDSINNL